MPYSKPYLSLNQQLALITGRGMGVSRPERAKSYLERIGYYRLSGYWYPYRVSTGSGQTLIVGDNFKPGTEFAEIVNLYIFDKKLRLLMLDIIERIEVSLRVQLTLQLGQYHPQAHRDPSLLHGNFARRPDPATGVPPHREWLRRHDEAFDRSKEDFAKHFKRKYPGENPPIWIAAELWEFGAMSVLFGGMNKVDQTAVAATFNIKSFTIMETWIRAINIVRNLCAHHSRLWNRPVVIQPRWPSASDAPELAHLVANTHGQTRIYGIAVLCAFLLRSINPSSKWPKRLVALMTEFPQSRFIDISSAGFPSGWEAEGLWQ
jgi:abortive infection bacteriophage resistance protein